MYEDAVTLVGNGMSVTLYLGLFLSTLIVVTSFYNLLKFEWKVWEIFWCYFCLRPMFKLKVFFACFKGEDFGSLWDFWGDYELFNGMLVILYLCVES